MVVLFSLFVNNDVSEWNCAIIFYNIREHNGLLLAVDFCTSLTCRECVLGYSVAWVHDGLIFVRYINCSSLHSILNVPCEGDLNKF